MEIRKALGNLCAKAESSGVGFDSSELDSRLCRVVNALHSTDPEPLRYGSLMPGQRFTRDRLRRIAGCVRRLKDEIRKLRETEFVGHLPGGCPGIRPASLH